VDPLSQSFDGTPLHVCEHLELIDDVRQARKRRPLLWSAGVALIVVLLGSISGVSACLYTQGQAAGATTVRVGVIEQRAAEDRAEADRRAERQRQQDVANELRQTEVLQALHALDSRLARIEERLPPRR